MLDPTNLFGDEDPPANILLMPNHAKSTSHSDADSIILLQPERPEFPFRHLPSPLLEIINEFSKFGAVPESIAFLTVATQLSMALGKNLRVQSGANRITSGNIQVIIFVRSAGG